ncbi:MAG: lipoyl synthase [Rikenellaceae bacterium]|jgi:lipoic acid synthetase|nr:lipoyl synthase [Rikenellaceae bacterium]
MFKTDGKVTRKPAWLKIKLHEGAGYAQVAKLIGNNELHTICVSGKCPNQAECWSRGTATFMILGDICTRSCKFCATLTGKPLPVDPAEPARVARSVFAMGLKYVVLTSVDRDDLSDGGAAHWAETIRQIRNHNPHSDIEVLIPDFDGDVALLDVVLAARPDVVAHNVETVRELTPQVRSRARYETSLGVIRHVARTGIPAKSGIMLGLGETQEQVLATFDDLAEAGCRRLTIGQYLQPTAKQLSVVEYIHPDQFAWYRRQALKRGFTQVESGPLVRSSYRAEQAETENKARA